MSRFTDLLADPEAEKWFLCVLEPYDPATATVRPVYLSSHGFLSAPSDTPASIYWDGRLQTPYSFARSLFSSGKLSGRSVPGAGTIALNSGDGGLDYLATLAWGGRRVRVYLGGEDFAFGEYGVIFDGTALSPAYGDAEITINLRDLSYVFDTEIQRSKFAGTGGNEGTDDLKDQLKPDAWGICRNIEPIFLGAVSGQYRFSFASAAALGVLAVYDRGVPLTYAASPVAGQYSVDLTSATIVLGGAFNGPVTADVIGRRYLSVSSGSSLAVGTGTRAFTVAAGQRLSAGMRVRATRDADPADTWMDGVIASYTGTVLSVTVDGTRGAGTVTDWTISPWGTVAGILRALAVTAGVTAFDDAAMTALDLYQPASVGIWLSQGSNGLQVLDTLADGAGCYWGFDRAASFEAGRIEAPGTPSAAYDATQVLSVERIATEEPNFEVTLRYRRNWRVLSTADLAGVVDAAKTFFTSEWRQSVATSPTTKAAYPLSAPIVVDSIFDDQAAATAEAARQLALFSVRRDYFKVRVKVQPLASENGDTVAITHSRYGLSAGKALRVVDLTEDMADFEVELGVWG